MRKMELEQEAIERRGEWENGQRPKEQQQGEGEQSEKTARERKW